MQRYKWEPKYVLSFVTQCKECRDVDEGLMCLGHEINEVYCRFGAHNYYDKLFLDLRPGVRSRDPTNSDSSESVKRIYLHAPCEGVLSHPTLRAYSLSFPFFQKGYGP